MHDPDPDIREVTAEALIKLGESATSHIREKLHSGNLPCRETAIQILRQIHTEEARDSLIFALNDESAWVRLPAVLALAERGDTVSMQSLQLVLSDEDARVQEAAKTALQL